MKKLIAVAAASVAATFGLCGCSFDSRTPSQKINDLCDELALVFMGDDAFAWNAYALDPEQSFGYERYAEPQWYSYSKLNSTSARMLARQLKNYKSDLGKIKFVELSAADAVKYRAVQNALDPLISMYDSKYAVEFDLLNGGYVNSEGGYVESFATSFENFELRNERDVKDLITVTRSTDGAFSTYSTFVKDRTEMGYPLYDYSIKGMREYLDDVTASGDEFYLYEIARNKIAAADFLSEDNRNKYEERLVSALDDNFMKGVSALSKDLAQYEATAKTASKSYLASAGAVGEAYYEWKFENMTGQTDVDLDALYETLRKEYLKSVEKADGIIATVDALENTDPQTYDAFDAYMNGESALLGLETPQEILDYLKDAAKLIVPDLKSTPKIDFKYMDETAAKRSNALAYYMSTPIDDPSSDENITLNWVTINSDRGSDLLPLLAHEGYPGHLYAHARSKEVGESLLSVAMGCLAFSEGWGQYSELAVLHNIATAKGGVSKADSLYAEYSIQNTYGGYLSSMLTEMQINYFGYSVKDYVKLGIDADNAQKMIEVYMERPAVYVPYGYGMYSVAKLHERAAKELGDGYNAPDFNAALLSEGSSPTLDRAEQITDEYINSKKG